MTDIKDTLVKQGFEAFNSGYQAAMKELFTTPADIEEFEKLARMSEESWNEIRSAYVYKRFLLTLINQYKAEGYIAATLDKFAQLVENGHDGWTFGDDQE